MLMMLLSVTVITCRKDNNGGAGTGPVFVRMMDAPSPYNFEKVWIDVKRVEVNISNPSTGESSWVTLQTNAGIYSLLDLLNGRDTLLANGIVAAGELEQLRFVLGTENHVMVDGITYPLDVPSGSTSGLKVNVHQVVAANRPLMLYIDFDAAQSIVVNGNGTFSLKPVLHEFVLSETGIVSGSVTNATPAVAITLASREGTYATYADPVTGEFKLRGVSPGTYLMSAYPKDSDIPVVKVNVEVIAGQTTDVGTISLIR
jgi:hypothetical protein